jgi:lipopolysaccharide export system permease protein
MFTIIDRYMLRQFVQVFVICMMSLIGLYIVIDAFGHLDRFVEYADKHHGNLLVIMGVYYAYQAIEFFDRTSGTLTLIAVMFTITWIQRHQEMTALLAAGISRMRVMRSVLLAAICVSLFAAANRELIMPNIREHLANDSKNLGGEQETLMQSHFDSQTDILLGGEKIVAATQKIVNPSFVLPRQLSQFGNQVNAKEARFLPANGDQPSGYLLTAITTPKALLKSPALLLGDKPIVLTPVGYDWLQKDQIFIVSGVSFEFLAAGATWRDFASTHEMIEQLRSPSTDLGADVRVAIHGRFIQPFLDTTLLFLGLPFVVTRTNRNPFISIGLCLAVVTVFMFTELGCQQLGTKGLLEPPLAAWMPLMIFAPVAAAMGDSLQK